MEIVAGGYFCQECGELFARVTLEAFAETDRRPLEQNSQISRLVEAPKMNQEVAVFAELYRLQVDYWHDVDHNYGRNAKTFYTEDGVFALRGERLKGPAEIAAFYAWREKRGDRTSRHLIANCRLNRLAGDRAEVECILSIYADDGVPVLQAQAPVMIMDVVARCVRELDAWRFESHVLSTIFQGGAKLSVPTRAELLTRPAEESGAGPKDDEGAQKPPADN